MRKYLTHSLSIHVRWTDIYVAAHFYVCSCSDTIFHPAQACTAQALACTVDLLRHGPEMGPYRVPKTGESLLNITGGKDPLRVVPPLFNQARIGQSSPIHGTSEGFLLNTITFTISLNVGLQRHSSVTLSGLRGSNTSDTANMPIESSPGLFNTLGSWTRFTGSLTITAAFYIPVNTSVTVRFRILNSFNAQEAPSVNASAGVVVDPLLSAVDPNNVARAQPIAMLHSRALQGKMAPLFVEPGFTTKIIGQSSATFSALNMLSVTFAMNTLVKSRCMIIISGLYGASAPSGAISLHGLSKDRFVSNMSHVDAPELRGRGTWDNIAKSLHLIVVSDITACTAVCSSNIVIRFEVHNPPLAQPSAPIHIEISGSVRIQTTPMEYGITGAMLVQTAFVRKVIGQSTFFPNTSNIITATLCSNVPLLQRRSAALHISGLRGAVAAHGVLIPLRACSCTLPLTQYAVNSSCTCSPTSETAKALFRPNNCDDNNMGHGVWNASDFSLSLYLKTDSNVEEAVKMEFNLTNPTNSQPASQIYISARGPYIDPQPMVPFSAETAPIRVVENSFILKRAGQQTPFPNAVNLITITVRSNVPFQLDDVIVISGLVGARPLPSMLFVNDYARVQLSANGISEDFRLFSHDGSTNQKGTGSWMQCNSDGRTCNFEGACSSSELHLRVAQSIESGRSLIFSFPLVNPVKDSPIAVIPGQDVVCRTCSAPATLLISATRGSNTQFVKPSPFSLDAIRVPDVSVGLQAGEAQVLVIRSRSMIISRIAQSNNRPGEMNTLSVTLMSSVNLTHEAPSAHITIFGLEGARAENGPLQLSGSSIQHFDSGRSGNAGMGRWDNVMKSLTLRITQKAPGFMAGVEYTFSFTIQNPWNPVVQTAPDVYVGLQIGTYQTQTEMTNAAGTRNGVLGISPFAAMHVEATRFGKYGDTLLASTRIAQDTNAPNAINNITLSFEVNVKLVKGAIISVSGIKGYIPSVHAQTPGGETTVNTEMATTTTLISLASSTVLPQIRLDDIFLRIEDEVVKVTRMGACFSSLSPCEFSPSNVRGKSNECPIGPTGACLQTWVQISRGAFNTVAASHASGVKVSNVLQLWQPIAEIFEPFAAWDRSAGVLALAIKNGSRHSYDRVYNTTFTLRNPADFNPPPSLSIQSTYVTIGKMPLLSPSPEQIPLNVLRPEFIVKNISQSTSFPQGNNSITVELESTVAQFGRDFSVITMTGFEGSTTATNSELMLFNPSPEFQRDFRSTAIWQQGEGKLRLLVRPTERMRPGVRYYFSFLLDNPAFEQLAKPILISISTGTVPVAGSRMYQPSIREQQVLHVSPPLFIEATAVQSRPYPGSPVTIRLRFTTNTQLFGPKVALADGPLVSEGGDTIGVSGLRNSLPRIQGESKDEVDIKITDVQGEGGMEDAAGAYATWSRARGSLLLKLGIGKNLRAGQKYSFEFTLRSPAQANDPTPEFTTAKPTDPLRDPADTGLYVLANRTAYVTNLEGFKVMQEYTLIKETLMLRNDDLARLNLQALIKTMGAENECPMPSLPNAADRVRIKGFNECPSSGSKCCPSFEDVMPLQSHKPQLLRSTITQSSNLPGDLNQITVRVVANVEIFELMICGLTGTHTRTQTHTLTHACIYIYIYIYMCVCVCI